MYDVVVYADIIDGHSKYLDKSIKCRNYSSSYTILISNKNETQKDDEEFRTMYCIGCMKIPWFKRKELSLSDSVRSFKNKGLDASTRLKNSFKNLFD